MRFWFVASLLLAACDHSAPTAYLYQPLGPYSGGTDLQVTFNPRPDYSPSWTEDGRGILYVYSTDITRHDDRCIGLLPAAGGTRVWSFCDDDQRLVADSATSFGGAALADDGALLYVEAISPLEPSGTHAVFGIARATLWLADTADPRARTMQTAFPTVVDGQRIDWMENIAWTGPATFVALADTLTIKLTDRQTVDTLRWPVAMVRGTTGPAGMQLTVITGTVGARHYALIAGGSTVLFDNGTLDLQQVPVGGGAPITATTIPPDTSRTLLDFSCQATKCLLQTTQFRTIGSIPLPTLTEGFLSLDLTSGRFTDIKYNYPVNSIAPRLAPTGGDVVMEKDTLGTINLHLYRGFVP
jgi:hypothetical protein